MVIFWIEILWIALLWTHPSTTVSETIPPGADHKIPFVLKGNVITDCAFAGKPICCEAVTPEIGMYPKSHLYKSPNTRSNLYANHIHGRCNITMKYISSPYELKHLEAAKNISLLSSSESERAKALLEFIWNDIPDSNIWLRKVRQRSQSTNSSVYSEDDDALYFSRFRFTQHCTHHQKLTQSTHTWNEWIEPLTVHNRHPFGWIQCAKFRHSITYDQAKQTFSWPERNLQHKVDFPGVMDIMDTSYILVANSEEMQLRSLWSSQQSSAGGSTSSSSGKTSSHKLHSTVINSNNNQASSNHISKNYMIDAGSSRFDSSLWWFVCTHAQRGIAFDHIYGYEVSTFGQEEFWGRVPPAIFPLYSFYNHPVGAVESEGHSVARLIKQIAKPEDFVSFKLDIDTTSVEMPIALQLLNDAKFAALIDEFYFELHFHCEIMLECGWYRAIIPNDFDGLKMERFSVMTFFQELRSKRGIRAHMWV